MNVKDLEGGAGHANVDVDAVEGADPRISTNDGSGTSRYDTVFREKTLDCFAKVTPWR